MLSASSQIAVGSLAAAPKFPSNHPAKVKRVIQIVMRGAPSHIDLWDPKPILNKFHFKNIPEINGVALGTGFSTIPSGQSGMPCSELFPHFQSHVDDIALIRSMTTNVPAHDQATFMMNTGSTNLVRPCFGSWLVHGLGSMNQNLPSFIVINGAKGGERNWSSAFLPDEHQGTLITDTDVDAERVIPYLKGHQPYESQARQLKFLSDLESDSVKRLGVRKEWDARQKVYGLAYRMQTNAIEAFDTKSESQEILNLYGDVKHSKDMLIARRLLEKGVRFVQVWTDGWDHHKEININLKKSCREIDQPLAALIKDLKQRGLYEDTLILCGGEFGRTPRTDRAGGATVQPGRDHHHHAFFTWMAGGPIKGGTIYGATDDFGQHVIENKVSYHDIHATMLHLFGIDHQRFTYNYSGRDFRLTDVYGNVIREVLA